MLCVPAMAHNWKQRKHRTEAFVTAEVAPAVPERAENS
jgi:hypothetical protein